MFNAKDIEYISKESGAGLKSTQNMINLLNEGLSVPFISRYRKEATGNLDEVKVQLVKDLYEYIQELNNRKETIISTIKGQEKLTEELERKIRDVYSKTELEDLYLPFKPRKRTRGTIAREKGLEPLADLILDKSETGPAEKMAADYIDSEKGVETTEDALKGASDIVAEKFSENSELRHSVRKHIRERGVLKVSVTSEWVDKRSKYEQYYEFSELYKNIPSHRLLAVRRGEEEKVLKVSVETDREEIKRLFCSIVYDSDHIRSEFLSASLEDSLKRLILPSVETEINGEMKKVADEEAIKVFATNLEKLLLAPAAGDMRVIAIDPGFRTGCKLVVLDETGKLLEHTVIYPTKPQEDIKGSAETLNSLVKKHRVNAVVIGNGTASRETFSFAKKALPEGVIATVVSESGASVYSASAVAREEMPEYDVTVRGAVSIGRRFQDPLSELVKIDPKSIGVGQYQHDVNQGLLKIKLDNVVESVVNRVGIELNTASRYLLKYVSGIGRTLAANIVEYRDNNGSFSSRAELKKVRMFGAKAFLQSAGFLRIRGGDNFLDNTGIHPESYGIVENIAKSSNINVNELAGNSELLDSLKKTDYVEGDFGVHTVGDVIDELRNPGRDPRSDFALFEFEEGVEEISDLKTGMELNGVVTNVAQFGAFVDVGVHQDGLVHISELSHKFITSPDEVVAVGDKVRVVVTGVDEKLKRIQLSMKALQEKPANDRRNRKRNNRNQKRKPQADSGIDSLRKKWGCS